MLDELEIIDSVFSDNTKIGILNLALQEYLRWINVFPFNNNWKVCCDYDKRIILDITFSHLEVKKVHEKEKISKYFSSENMSLKKRIKIKK